MKLELKSLNFKAKNFIPKVLGGIIFLILILDLFLYMPLLNNINQLKEKLESDSKDVVFGKNFLAKNNNKISRKYVQSRDLQSLIDQILELADTNNVELIFKNSSGVDKPGNEKASFIQRIYSVEGAGTLKNFGNFLTAVASISSAIIDVDKIVISQHPDRSSNIQVQMDLVVLTAK